MQKVKGDEYAMKFQQLCAGGLIGISLVFIQNFGGGGAGGTGSIDIPSEIATIAFALALPFLGGIFVLTIVHEEYPYGSPRSLIAKLTHVGYVFGIVCATIGVGAALWHIVWVAGIAFIVALAIAMVIYSIYMLNLEKKPEKESAVTISREKMNGKGLPPLTNELPPLT